MDPFGGQADLEGAAPARCRARRYSATTRCGCCAPCGSRTSSTCASMRKPSGSCASTPRSWARRPANGSWPSCGASRPRAIAGSTGSGCCSRWAAESRIASTAGTHPTTGWSLSSARSCAASRSRTSSVATRGPWCGPRAGGRSSRDPPLSSGDRAVGPGGARVPRCLRAGAGDRAGTEQRAARAAVARGRARVASRAGDRAAARRDRGRAGRRYDLHEGGGARLCKTPLAIGSGRRLTASPRSRTNVPMSSRRRWCGSSSPAGTSGRSTPAAAPARSPSRWRRMCARSSPSISFPSCSSKGASEASSSRT